MLSGGCVLFHNDKTVDDVVAVVVAVKGSSLENENSAQETERVRHLPSL